MHDLTTFERRLAERLERELAAGSTVFDPSAIARAAMGRRRLADVVTNAMGLGAQATPRRSNVLVAVVALVLLAAAIVALGVGPSLVTTPPPGEPRLASINAAGDLILARSDGADATRIASGNGPDERGDVRVGFTDVVWAPGGAHLALSQARPGGGIDLVILDRDGHVALRTDLRQPAEYAWAPDGRRLAILSGSDVTGSLVDPPPLAQYGLLDVRLQVVGVDGSSTSLEMPGNFSFASDVRNLAWTGGSGKIAVTGVVASGTNAGAESHVWLVDPDSGAIEQLTDDPDVFDYAPAWSSDGWLYIARQGPTGHAIWRIGRTVEHVVDWDGPIAAIEPSHGGSQLAVLSQQVSPRGDPGAGPVLRPRLATISLASTGATELMPSAGFAFGWHLDWNASGGSVLWLDSGTGLPADLVSSDATTGDLSTLVRGVVAFDLSEAAR